MMTMTVGQPAGVSTPMRLRTTNTNAYTTPTIATRTPVRVHRRSGIEENWISESTASLIILRVVQRDSPLRRASWS